METVDLIIEEINELKLLGIPLYSKKTRVRRLLVQLKQQTSFLKGKKPSTVSRIYCLTHNIKSVPECSHPDCSNCCVFLSEKDGFRKWCSSVCSSSEIGQQIIRQQIKDTNLLKYGHECSLHNPSIHAKMITDNVTKYGVEYAGASLPSRAKRKQTNIVKYGTEHPWANEDIKDQIRHTMTVRYGVKSVGSVVEFRSKITQTNLRKYGVAYPIQNKTISNKSRTTRMHRYNRPFSNQTHLSTATLSTLNDADWLRSRHIDDTQTLTEIAVELGVCTKTMTNYFKKHKIKVNRYAQSIGEKEICAFLDTIDVKYVTNDRSVLLKHELDIWIPSYNVAIEYCGVYWHSEQAGRGKWYHSNKQTECDQLGIRLITIFEDEWKDRKHVVTSTLAYICNKLKLDTVYARKTTVIDLSKDKGTRKTFLNSNHIQGNGLGSICYGLNYNDNMVACMLFSIRGDVVYLERYATSLNVPGGFTKLLTHFIRNNPNVTKITTFADLRWSQGKLYVNNGFKLVKTLCPDYCYSLNGQTRLHKFNFRRNRLHKKLKHFDPLLSERQNCDNNGVLRIWDCGKLKYEYTV